MTGEPVTDKMEAIASTRGMTEALANIFTACDLACHNLNTLNTSLHHMALILQSEGDVRNTQYQTALGQIRTLRTVLDVLEDALEERIIGQEQEGEV